MNNSTPAGTNRTKKLFLLLLLQVFLILFFDAQFEKITQKTESLIVKSNIRSHQSLKEFASNEEQIQSLFELYRNSLKNGQIDTFKAFLTSDSSISEKNKERIKEEYQKIKDKKITIKIIDEQNALITVDKTTTYEVKKVDGDWKLQVKYE